MELNGHELEMEYVGYKTQLGLFKKGHYGRNIWHWVIRLYLRFMLVKRFFKLRKDFKSGFIEPEAYKIYKTMLIH